MSKSLMLAALFALLASPASVPKPASKHIRRAVSLDTVLSCRDDSLFSKVFHTDLSKALSLDGILMTMAKYHKYKVSNYALLRAEGFVTFPTDNGSDLRVSPTDALGKDIPELKLPFCHDEPVAHYKSGDSSGLPVFIVIDGSGWSLNPNQLFTHADQFKFKSGVFTDSSKVYFDATKGKVLIQFVPTASGLKFYRAMYLRLDQWPQ